MAIKAKKIQPSKVAAINAEKERIGSVNDFIFTDYRGITVAEDTELRAEMRKAGVEYAVIKNHIMVRACESLDIDAKETHIFKGPSAFAFGYDDIAAPARILKAFVKKAKKCELKGGIVEKNILNATEIEAIADMPSREVLIARMLGSMLSPISKFAIVINEIAKKQGGEQA